MKKFKVISASRRTDIPGCHLRNFLKNIELGYIDVPQVRNPTRTTRVSLSPNDVNVIAWWSKDYKKWIRSYIKEPLLHQYRHYFNFTLTGDDVLEHIPTTLTARLEQLRFLVENFGVLAMNLRFDPVVHYKLLTDPNQETKHNLQHFSQIIAYAASLGIKDVTFSFCLAYPKVTRRMRDRGKILIDLSDEEKHAVTTFMVNEAKAAGITLRSCCSVSHPEVEPGRCIDVEKIDAILGKRLTTRSKDRGQRQECNCVVSKDIGSYDQKCGHNCDYCYATPDDHLDIGYFPDDDDDLDEDPGCSQITQLLTQVGF